MQVSIKMLLFTFSLVLFLAGLTIGVSLYKESSRAIDNIQILNTSQDRSMISGHVIPNEYTVKGEEVLQSLFHIKEIDADIEIDGELFSKDLVIENTVVNHINIIKLYRPIHERDSNGKLIRVMYNSL